MWLGDNFLSLFAGFLLVFIPLYPKLPLFDALPGYIVRVRLEDLLVTGAIVIWVSQLLAGKIKLKENPLVKPISLYLIVGILSMLSAVFVINTVPRESLHVGKLLLHFLRRIEYFSLFFILFSSVKSLKLFKAFIGLLALTTLAVSFYGFGQKYLFWPAFSTMNREFSKGWVLYLTEHARVLSTFGGHYDLAAFIMMVLVLFWSLFFGVKKWLLKIGIFVLIAAAFWTLILTASRTSFIAYLVGIIVMFGVWTFKKGIKWSVPRCAGVLILSVIVMLSFGDLSERFTKLLKIDRRIEGIKSLLLSPIGRRPSGRAVFLENNPDALSQITSKSDQPPTPLRPSDVFQDIPLVIPSASGGSEIVARTYSRTAFQYDLSTAIRLDALWPMAIAGFKRNPIVGSGYSTLNKQQMTDFTEAESTDNDFLRTLGETGILGFMAFYGTVLLVVYLIFRNLNALSDPILTSASIGLIGLIAGLLVNALYIDVFVASKVAFSFWAFTGLVLGGVAVSRRLNYGDTPVPPPHIPDLSNSILVVRQNILRFFKSDKFFLLIILLVAFVVRLYKINEPLADWHSWRQADTSAVTRNFVRHGINILYPVYDDLSNIASGKDNPNGYRYVEFPLYNAFATIIDKLAIGDTVEFSGRFASILASLGTIAFLFLLMRKHLGRIHAICGSSFFALIPYSIFYSRVILPEPFLVFTSTGMIYFFDQMIEKMVNGQLLMVNWKGKIKFIALLLSSLLFTASSLLVKPYAAFLFLPMVYLWFRKIKITPLSIIGLLGYWVIGLLPFVWWRWWVGHFPEGIPAYAWLLNGDGIRFKGAFFQWIFADRIGRLILGYWGITILVAGIVAGRRKAEGWLFHLWGVTILLYLFVFATGNVRHDYYQAITIPIICIFLAKGMVFLYEATRERGNKWITIPTFAVVVVFSLMFGWYHIRDFYNINHREIVEAGAALDRIAPSEALVIAPYNGDTAFLYQTGRAGWPIMQRSVEDMIKMGAHYYVSVDADQLTKELYRDATIEDPLLRKYKLVSEKDSPFVIIQLVPDNKLPR